MFTHEHNIFSKCNNTSETIKSIEHTAVFAVCLIC